MQELEFLGQKLIVFDLTHNLYHDMPTYPTVENFRIESINHVAKDGFAAKRIMMITHHGTHIDAAAHMIEDGKTIDRYEISHFIINAVILNLKGLNAGEEITSTHLKRFNNVISKNQGILIYTGWSDKRGWNKEYLTQWPYLDIDGAEYIASFPNIKMVGTDGLSIAGYGEKAHVFETHKILLSKDIIILEELNFKDIKSLLDSKEYVEGYVIALPLLIKDADGAPARVIFLIKA
jgi:kynurenine formamidase